MTRFDTDENVRDGLTIDMLRKLKPCFVEENGTVTAENFSSLNNAVAAIVIMYLEKARSFSQA